MNRIRDARRTRKMTLEQLAAAVGVTPAQVSRWERDLSAISVDRLGKIAAALGVSAEILLPPEDDLFAGNARPFRMEGASAARMKEDIPIYGTALGSPRMIDGEAVEQTTLNTSDIVQYAKRPVILDGRADAYGLYVQGHSMEPVHLAGDVCLVESKRPARIGDDVVVYLRPKDRSDDGERARAVLIKRLVRRTAVYVELEQFNPALRFHLPVGDILRMDRVLRLADLIA